MPDLTITISTETVARIKSALLGHGMIEPDATDQDAQEVARQICIESLKNFVNSYERSSFTPAIPDIT